MALPTANSMAKAAIQERIMPEDRVVYIGNGVPLEAFGLPPNPSLRAELGLDAEDKVVGFIKSLRWIPLSLLGGTLLFLIPTSLLL